MYSNNKVIQKLDINMKWCSTVLMIQKIQVEINSKNGNKHDRQL